MTGSPQLHWLPAEPAFRTRLRALRAGAADAAAWAEAIALANTRLDFVQTNALDETVRRLFAGPPEGLATKPVRLAGDPGRGAAARHLALHL